MIANLESKWGSNADNLRTGYAYTVDERGQRSKVVQSGDAYSDYGDVTAQQFAYNGRGGARKRGQVLMFNVPFSRAPTRRSATSSPTSGVLDRHPPWHGPR